MASLVGRITDVSGNGPFEAKLNGMSIRFNRVPEQSVMRPASTQDHHFQRRWWVTHEDYRNIVYIVGADPRDVRELNLEDPVAIIEKDHIKIE